MVITLRRLVTVSRSTGLALIAIAYAGCGGGTRATPRTAVPAPDGGRLFVKSGCGHCHALASAGTRGGSGPDFDTSEKLDLRQIRTSLVEGSNGMPSYAGRLTSRQLDAIAAFIHHSTR